MIRASPLEVISGNPDPDPADFTRPLNPWATFMDETRAVAFVANRPSTRGGIKADAMRRPAAARSTLERSMPGVDRYGRTASSEGPALHNLSLRSLTLLPDARVAAGTSIVSRPVTSPAASPQPDAADPLMAGARRHGPGV
jgi:hypothetical protein